MSDSFFFLNQKILTDCNVVNLQRGKIERGLDVEIQRNRINSLEKPDTYVSSEIIDMKDSFLVPGLFNMHNNLSMVFPFKNTDLGESSAVTVLRCYKRALDALQAGSLR